MKKAAYLLLTDLHFAFRMAARKNYFKEIFDILNKILEIKDKYEQQDYEVNLIILGDLFNRGISDPTEAMHALELFKYVFSLFHNVYAVIGNHEFTYYKNNPFWFLVSQIEDESILKMHKKMKQPLGFTNYITIPDRIIDGNVSFVFNHYGVGIKEITKGANVNIGLFHQDIASEQISKMYSKYEDIEKNEKLSYYDYCFFAHLHTASGKYNINDKFIAYYLQSLGRTNHTEIDDLDLERMIPVVKVIDGNFDAIDENKIKLPSREEILNIDQILVTQKKYQESKAIKQETEHIVLGTSLYETLCKSVLGTNDAVMIDLLSKSETDMKKEYFAYLNETIIEEEQNNV